MVFKDYYKILELAPGASVADIKKSFRRLALLYHPDRNFGSTLHEAKFKEIKEAYEVLSNTKHRQEYNSQRREQQSQPAEKKKPYEPPTSVVILSQATEFRKKIVGLDPQRINKRAVYHRIQHLLAIQNILILKHANDVRISRQFIDEILQCSGFLLFPEVDKICNQLLELAGTDNESYRKIYHFSRQSRVHTYWSRYKLLIAIIFAFILCLLIFLISTNF